MEIIKVLIQETIKNKIETKIWKKLLKYDESEIIKNKENFLKISVTNLFLKMKN